MLVTGQLLKMDTYVLTLRKSYDFIKQKIQSAQWFVDAINQRNNTLNGRK